MSNWQNFNHSGSRRNRPRFALVRAAAILLLAARLQGVECMAAAATPKTPSGYQQTNLISNGAVDALHEYSTFVDPWGVSIGTDLWINTNVTGLNYITSATGAESFTVSIPPASGSGPGSPTGTVFAGNVPAGSFLLKDGSPPAFLFCTLDGTVSGWPDKEGGAQLRVNNNKAGAIYNDMALLTNSEGTFLVLANFGKGADVEVYDKDYNRTMTSAFKDPHVPATYAPYAVHVFGDTVYVTYTPRTVPGYQEILGEGHGFVDAFSTTGSFQGRVVPIGDKLDAPWGMAIAPATFGEFASDVLVGNFGDGTISAYDPKTWAFKGNIKDENGNVIANPGLWEIFFGQVSPAVGNPNSLYFTAGLNQETAGLFGTITVASSKVTKTTTTVTSDGNPSSTGEKVTFTALVQPSSGTGEPEGKVSFAVDGKALATSAVDSTAHATATAANLAVGKHTVAASYSGDANFDSSHGTMTENIQAPTTAAPTFSPAFGTTYSSAQNVSITDNTTGAKIYYTTNGSTPTPSSTEEYSNPIPVTATTTIKAIAKASNLPASTVVVATYTISSTAPPVAPTMNPPAGTYSSAQSVTISDKTSGATIYYTTDGSTPTTTSAVYKSAIAVSQSMYINAIAVANGEQSTENSSWYSIGSSGGW